MKQVIAFNNHGQRQGDIRSVSDDYVPDLFETTVLPTAAHQVFNLTTKKWEDAPKAVSQDAEIAALKQQVAQLQTVITSFATAAPAVTKEA